MVESVAVQFLPVDDLKGDFDMASKLTIAISVQTPASAILFPMDS
jgi:hypothetical protein